MSMMSAQNVLIELLRREGVEYVFGIPGATEILFMEALESAPDIRYVLSLHEIVCAGMAEGYARASGKVGFLNLHNGPGLAAALPMLYNARTGGVPLVITVGQNDSRLLQYDPHLFGDNVDMGRIYSKWSAEITHKEDLPVALQRAFKMALQPPLGPVVISMPQNVLEGEFDFEHKANTMVFSRLRPDRSALEAAFTLIRQAKNPMILVESGVARCDALDEVVRFAELIGARVYQNWMADVNFPVSHSQYLGDFDLNAPTSKAAFDGTDLLIGVGCSLFAQAFYAPAEKLPKGIRIIHIDENPWEIGKNLPTDCGIHADIKSALSELNQMFEAGLSSGERAKIKERVDGIADEKAGQDESFAEQVKADWGRTPISVSRFAAEVREALPSGAVIVDDCWSSSSVLRKTIKPSRSRSFFRARKGGSIGWGLPGALGVKLGLPDAPVVAVSGDGSAAWSMQSLWTAARERIPVTFVVTNNAVYRQVKLVRRVVLGDYPLNERHLGMELDDPVVDFTMLAQSMGVRAEAVRDPGDLCGALKRAFDSGEPRLVEVFVENGP
jgi:benzoylformate decarboxylase